MNKDELKAYRRGYNQARTGRWPELASIPEDRYRELAVAAKTLSDCIDTMLAGFDDRETDPQQLAIDAARDVVTAHVLRALDAGLAEMEPR